MSESQQQEEHRHADGCEGRYWRAGSPRYKGPCTCGLEGRAEWSYDELQKAYAKLVASYHEFAECVLFSTDDPVIHNYVKEYVADVGLDL
ncbi:hypothetical protein LCGC14_0455670 [marine sediment metagenome]|uniref:Uncharacterized protein n=1 Tax=marine sediment metagenome TaxID=412755 RepID=A0A0F9V3C0_9ZZZZ